MFCMDGLLFGVIGVLAGSILGFFGSMRVKSSITKDARNTYKEIIEMKSKTIASLRGKLSQMSKVDVQSIEKGGDNAFSDLLNAFIDEVPKGWGGVLKPAAEAAKEKWDTNPEFKAKVTGAVTNFLERAGSNGKVEEPQAKETL